MGGCSMTRFVGLDVSQKLTAICVVGRCCTGQWGGRDNPNPRL